MHQAYFLLVFYYVVYVAIVPPKILNNSRDMTVEIAADVRLECFAAGRPSPRISWYKYTHTGQRIG